MRTTNHNPEADAAAIKIMAEHDVYQRALKAIRVYAYQEENAIICIRRIKSITSKVLGYDYDEDTPFNPEDMKNLEETIDE